MPTRYRSSPRTEKMSQILRNVIDFITPKSFQSNLDFLTIMKNYTVVEATNECGEKRYLQIPKHDPMDITERRENLNFLYRKCKEILSFLSRKRRYSYEHEKFDNLYFKVVDLKQKIKDALKQGDEGDSVMHFYDSFIRLRSEARGSFSSSKDLSIL